MKPKFLLFPLLAISLFCSCTQQSTKLSDIDPGQFDSTWWNNKPLRFIQTNLNERDAIMDIDAYVQTLVSSSVNVVLFNVGGIVANYPTQLPFHYINPYLKNDLVGEVVKKLHQNGIKVVGRFDFSKINEKLAVQKPEWLYVGTDGKNVNYNGQVHTCINGGYQQAYNFEILKEAISRYPLDGVFFNMGGYGTSDYSQVDHGICQCQNCKKRFNDSTGLVLPTMPDNSSIAYRKYVEFQSKTIAELYTRIQKYIKGLNPNIVLCHPSGEIVRSESGTAFTSAKDWNYHATENVKKVLGSSKNKTSIDNFNYLMGMDYRHVATSPNIGRIMILEQMLNGTNLGVYVMGRLESQLDRVLIPTIKEYYQFHKTNETLFTNLQSVSKVGIIYSNNNELRGIMKMLIEEHIMFDLIQQNMAGNPNATRQLKNYDVLILSNIENMSDKFISVIDSFVENGGKILATGFPGINDAIGTPIKHIRIKSIGIMPEYEVYNREKSTYLSVNSQDKSVFGTKEFEDFDVIMMYSSFLKCKTTKTAKGYFNLLPHVKNGPPEKCYFEENEVTNYPGVVVNEYGKGKAVLIPWQIGSQYEWKGNNAQRMLFMTSLLTVLKADNPLITNASPLIEMTHMANRNKTYEWIGMINHSGQLGDAFREPVTIHNTTIKFKPLYPVKEIRLVHNDKNIDFNINGEWIECIVPQISDFEMMLCLYK